jgi:hypothetical protein
VGEFKDRKGRSGGVGVNHAARKDV